MYFLCSFLSLLLPSLCLPFASQLVEDGADLSPGRLEWFPLRGGVGGVGIGSVTRGTRVGVGGELKLSPSLTREGCSSLGERKLALEAKDLVQILDLSLSEDVVLNTLFL